MLFCVLTRPTEWQGGGGAVPWSRLSKDNVFHYVQRSRLPSELDRLYSPGEWSRPILLAFYEWFIGEQQEKASRPQADWFQFRCVLDVAGQTVATYNSYCAHRHSASQLTWGPEEKLYAMQVDMMANHSNSTRVWKGLPLARTEGIYAPFSPTLLEELHRLNSRHINLSSLGELVNKLEHYGPCHVRFMFPFLCRFSDHLFRVKTHRNLARR